MIANHQAGCKIKEMPLADRPRERLMEKGAKNLKDSELLAILLGSGVKGKNVAVLAEEILRDYPKKKLLNLDFQELATIKGIGEAKACVILASQELVKRALAIKEDTLPAIRNINDIIAQAVYLREKQREHFLVLYLNGRGEMIYKKPMFVGTLNASLVHPREIFALALKQNAASVVFVHNHPSGNSEPSESDLLINKRLVEAGKIMGIAVIDHLILTKTNFVSFKQKKLM
ncbi:MAG: DNA repair protein RadC [Candidatus Gribaldobacteria bacterium]|nr:DNA repair protein RadC [Candidatus Gribaldobacteria bacterium]